MDGFTAGPFDEVKRSVLAEDIAGKVLELIREKRLEPGDKLPAERQLAAIMKVSRPSLREALRALSLMNIIEIKPGSGAYVTSLEPKLLVEHLDFVFSLDDSTFLQLFEARKILEVGIAGIAATHISDAELEVLEREFEKAESCIDNPTEFLDADIRLHEMIAKAARNPILERFMVSVSRLGRASRARTAEAEDVRYQTLEDHRAILDALHARDRTMAENAMLSHLAHIEKRLREMADAEEGVQTSGKHFGVK